MRVKIHAYHEGELLPQDIYRTSLSDAQVIDGNLHLDINIELQEGVENAHDVNVGMTITDARRLRALVNNPLSGDPNPYNEDPEEARFRGRIGDELDRVLNAGR